MKKVAKIVMLFVIPIILVACMANNTGVNVFPRERFPRQSFVYVSKTVILLACGILNDEKTCIPLPTLSLGSGFVIAKNKIMTAGHVCESHKGQIIKKATQTVKDKTASFDFFTNQLYENINADATIREMFEDPRTEVTVVIEEFNISDIDNNSHAAKVLKIDIDKDLCIMEVDKLEKPEIKLATIKPMEGDPIFNIASPEGIFAKNMVPIFSGIYVGEGNLKIQGKMRSISMFSIFATNGSSGSMVLNSKNELIGMITNAFDGKVPINVGPSFKSLSDFIRENL